MPNDNEVKMDCLHISSVLKASSEIYFHFSIYQIWSYYQKTIFNFQLLAENKFRLEAFFQLKALPISLFFNYTFDIYIAKWSK